MISHKKIILATLALTSLSAAPCFAAEQTEQAQAQKTLSRYTLSAGIAGVAALGGGLYTKNYAVAGLGLGTLTGTGCAMVRHDINKWIMYLGGYVVNTMATNSIIKRTDVSQVTVPESVKNSDIYKAMLKAHLEVLRQKDQDALGNHDVAILIVKDDARKLQAENLCKQMYVAGAIAYPALAATFASYQLYKYMEPKSESVS